MKARSQLLLAGLLLVHILFVVSPTCAQSIEDLKNGVVKVTAKVNGKTRIGTGFVVRMEKDAAYVVTAAHVIEGTSNIEVTFYTEQNRQFPTRIIGQEGGDAQGLAVLLVEKNVPKETKVLQFSQGVHPKAGDALTLIGFPRVAGVPWAVTKGEVVGRKAKALVFSGAVDEGSSGGPLIKGNQIIGVVTDMTGKFSHATPAIIASYVLEGYGVKFGMHLREEPVALKQDAVTRLVDEAQTFRHDYEESTIEGERVVIDRATWLMWQQEGSPKALTVANAIIYISKLNSARFAGFDDWRLPTSEELIFLMETKGENEGLFLATSFDHHQNRIWTSDRLTSNSGIGRIGVDFSTGSAGYGGGKHFVRAVRSIKERFGSTKTGSHSKSRDRHAEVISESPSDGVSAEIVQNGERQERIGKDGAPMVEIPAGEFWMGSSGKGYSRRGDGYDAYPRHLVYLDAFYLDKFEVTVAQFAKFFRQTSQAPIPHRWSTVNISTHGELPVVGVYWFHAEQYCRWAGKRLPTEAEWEKGARGTDERQYPWGNQEPTNNLANIARKWSHDWGYENALVPVNRYEEGKSPYGLHQMAGNVSEWTADWYDEDFYVVSPQRNPKGPSDGQTRVIRGGSWSDGPDDVRSANRDRALPGREGQDTIVSALDIGNVGFRCAQDVK